MPKPDHIYIITGGTVVHVSPHFSLCAPAYGQVGVALAQSLAAAVRVHNVQDRYQVHLVKTKMAGGASVETRAHLSALNLPENPETNEDVRMLVQGLLRLSATRCLVMAAAVCDFEPTRMAVLTRQQF